MHSLSMIPPSRKSAHEAIAQVELRRDLKPPQAGALHSFNNIQGNWRSLQHSWRSTTRLSPFYDMNMCTAF